MAASDLVTAAGALFAWRSRRMSIFVEDQGTAKKLALALIARKHGRYIHRGLRSGLLRLILTAVTNR